MIDFKQILLEAEMLDISIVSAKKYLTSDAKIQKFFETPVRIEEKLDGVKISVIKTNNPERPWVFAYKGSVIYDGEFEYASKSALKKSSISNSQFQIILDHFKMLPKASVDKIKPNTEFFIEFLMRKPTLSSNYEKSHGMVLIAYSPTVWSEKFGRLISKPKDFITDDREEKAKLLKLSVPAVIFEGIMGSDKMFQNGIKNNGLNSLYNEQSKSFSWSHYDILLGQVQNLFLALESSFGGKPEGVVVKYLDGSGTLLKFQQEYQIDQTARAAIKDKYRGTPEEEDMYYKQVRLVALDIINHMEITKDLPGMLSEFSKRLKAQRIDIEHGVKVKVNILDDIFNTGKMVITKKMKGNNGALYLGKFRVLTAAHYKIIKDAFAVYDHVVVALVSSAETKDTRELRERMLMTAFPKLEIVNVQNGNLFTIMNKASSNINVILAGSDRVASYTKMLEKNPDIRVREIKRTDEDISASKVVEALNKDDINTFKKMVDKSIWPFYEELRRVYANI
jgi:nicotinamide mononucleotide adenylyltransferase